MVKVSRVSANITLNYVWEVSSSFSHYVKSCHNPTCCLKLVVWSGDPDFLLCKGGTEPHD